MTDETLPARLLAWANAEYAKELPLGLRALLREAAAARRSDPPPSTPEGLCTKCSVTGYCAEHAPREAAEAVRADPPEQKCALCAKPQPCPEHGRTPITQADFEELTLDIAGEGRSDPPPVSTSGIAEQIAQMVEQSCDGTRSRLRSVDTIAGMIREHFPAARDRSSARSERTDQEGR
jgi:hypothetical protein